MPETAFERWTSRVGFAARQTGRVAWYTGHGLMLMRMVERLDAQSRTTPKRPARRRSRTLPVVGQRLADIAALLARDLANAEAGYYPVPEGEDGALPGVIARSRAFFRDVPEVVRRKQGGLSSEVADAAAGKRPDYYLQNFHFQSGGWLTEESARLYDMQVEVLFSGAANAMRRQALVPIAEALRGRDQRRVAYADIACGTGSFVRQVRQAFPRLPSVAIDLSEAYVAEARHRLGSRPSVQPVVAKAEALPLATESLDIATMIFLFHELPPDVRRAVARETARVMKPGGLLVFIDSLQIGDDPRRDGSLRNFPSAFHEPYFENYLDEDLEALFDDAGFKVEDKTNAFFAKVLTLRKKQ